ncbi:hypothetical protein ACFOUP_16530 [Belliella kenyensis]|uniref:Uncharacterized protein n=1 Tax=Belliella kenyensis TaxID=1472724 RepID=A0ABV8ESL6_9BACT|nr:hypothetical protein [Belliella kenyensis]MCH7403810.1 hypothetical protein [Belliella kenyensis]MDN3602405.1 hypothetical protein [Belliella kenyensis]
MLFGHVYGVLTVVVQEGFVQQDWLVKQVFSIIALVKAMAIIGRLGVAI